MRHTGGTNLQRITMVSLWEAAELTGVNIEVTREPSEIQRLSRELVHLGAKSCKNRNIIFD